MDLKSRKPNLNNFYYPHLYLPSQDFSDHDSFWNGSTLVEVNYTFKKAMRVIALQEQGDMEGIMQELGLSYEDSLSFLKGMAEQRWVSASEDTAKVLGLSADEQREIYESEKTFDYLKDFDAYYSDFRRFYGIDLIRDDISFVEFNWILESLMQIEDSAISKRRGYRTFKGGKDYSPEYTKAMTDLGRTYALRHKDNDSLYEILKKGGEHGR